MAQFGHRLLEVTDAASVPRDAKLLVTDGVTRCDDEIVQAIGVVLDEIDHGLALATEEGVADPGMQ